MAEVLVFALFVICLPGPAYTCPNTGAIDASRGTVTLTVSNPRIAVKTAYESV